MHMVRLRLWARTLAPTGKHARWLLHAPSTTLHCYALTLAFDYRVASICLSLLGKSCHAKFQVLLVSAQVGREHSMASDAWPPTRVPLRGILDHSNHPKFNLSNAVEPIRVSMSNAAWRYSMESYSKIRALLAQGQEAP